MSAPRTLPPELVTAVPGPRSTTLAERLARVESRNVTCTQPAPPIFWERASGANVWDVDGNRFVDLTAAFGVANTGHAHPRVADAVRDQAGELLHAMGDVHPAAVKVELLERLAARFPGGVPAKAVLGSSGSDAVEIALKTAQIATGKAGVVAFTGAYHGLTLGALEVTWRPLFREPFLARLPGTTVFAHFGDLEDVLRQAHSCPEPVGAKELLLPRSTQGLSNQPIRAPDLSARTRRDRPQRRVQAYSTDPDPHGRRCRQEHSRCAG